MPRPPLSDILKHVYTNIGTSSLALTCGRIEVAKFKMPQIKRQFNVFPLCLPSAFLAFGKAKKRKNIGMERDGVKNLGKDVKNSDCFLPITVAY